MSHHPDGGECAHLNVQAGLAGDDGDASHEQPYELRSVFETRGDEHQRAGSRIRDQEAWDSRARGRWWQTQARLTSFLCIVPNSATGAIVYILKRVTKLKPLTRQLAAWLFLSSQVLLSSCDVYRQQSVIIDGGTSPGWVVIEYGNNRCNPAGIFWETIQVSRDGFACSSSYLPVAFNWTIKRRRGDKLEDLHRGRDYDDGITITQPGRKFLLFRFTPNGERVTDNPEDAVARYLKSQPWLREH